VGRLARSFNTMASRVEETVSSLRRFVADAAHEIGTPLTALQADLDIAQGHAQPETRERFVEHAAVQAQRLEYLTSSLLRLSRIEAGDLSQDPRPIDLVALARQALDAVASRADQAEVDLHADIEERELWVRGYADKLEAAIANLLDNALKFTPGGGTVTLGLQRDGHQARLWVRDTGIGIPAEEMTELFSRFHRGRNVHSYPGSGLGLAIVRATAGLHGGTVTAQSEVGVGTRFDLLLPLLPAEGTAEGGGRGRG
jgi:signal transduction histidine kinase